MESVDKIERLATLERQTESHTLILLLDNCWQNGKVMRSGLNLDILQILLHIEAHIEGSTLRVKELYKLVSLLFRCKLCVLL